MLKLLFVILTMPIILCSETVSLPQYFPQAESMKGYNNGSEIVITEEQEDEIQKLLSEALLGSRDMPAYGVSLHNETLKAMQEGIWIEFKFAETTEFEGMPFDSLLIHLEKDTGGVNIIRQYEGLYDGRCFYLDLEHNFNDLYDYLALLDTYAVEEQATDDVDTESTNAEIPSVPHNKEEKPKVI